LIQNAMSNLQQYSQTVTQGHAKVVKYVKTSLGAEKSENEHFSIKYVLNFNTDDTFSIDIDENHMDK
jgi:hypothetical protein